MLYVRRQSESPDLRHGAASRVRHGLTVQPAAARVGPGSHVVRKATGGTHFGFLLHMRTCVRRMC